MRNRRKPALLTAALGGSAAVAATVAATVAAGAATAAETITYRYDARGRLVKVERAGSVNPGVATSYGYDKANNRRTRITTGAAN